MVAKKLGWSSGERELEKDILYQALLDRNEGKVFAIILPIAILLHVVMLFVHLPQRGTILEPVQKTEGIKTKRFDLTPPPPVQPRQIEPRRQTARQIPVPDPSPEIQNLAPVPEPMVGIEFSDEPVGIDVDFSIELGTIDAPPPSEPVQPGLNGVTEPILRLDSKIEPAYPELARKIRLEGNVVLRAVIRADGSVDELTVLRCSRPSMGFEEAAIEAVGQWLYEPATQDGLPVDVYFTVFIDFRLH